MPSDTPAPATDERPASAAGVIHDIGYRHFDGQRRGRGYIRRSLFVDSLRGAYGLGRSARSKVMPMLLLAAMCLPAGGIVAITAVTGAEELVGGYTSYLLGVQLVISVFVAAQAPALVSKDLRFHVTSLYFSRPLQRLDYVLGKFGAMVSALFILTAAPLTILFVGALIAGLPIGEQIPDYLRAVGGAAVLALILGGIGLLIAAVTPRRGLAVAAVVTVLVVLAGVQTVLYEIAVAQNAGESPAYFSLISPYTLVDTIQASLLGASSALPAPPEGIGLVVFPLAALLIIVGCFTALLLRYRSVSVS